VVALVHGETSTGVLNPVAELAPVVRDVGALWSVDAVTTVGMLPFEMAGWGIDYAYTGSQKCLSAPPGLAPVAVSARAMAHVAARRSRSSPGTPTSSACWATGPSATPAAATTTPSRSTCTGRPARRSGRRWTRAWPPAASARGGWASAVATALATVGFAHLVDADARLPTVLALTLPDGLDDATVRGVLRREERVSLTGGLGATAGRIWRLGLMGEAARPEPYRRLMQALAAVLPRFGLAAAVELPAAFEAAWDAAAPAAGRRRRDAVDAVPAVASGRRPADPAAG
jgi:alanine-glyoxylate transaminase / serine-glyoxylate transaminase / serine-pyruvate transaminase